MTETGKTATQRPKSPKSPSPQAAMLAAKMARANPSPVSAEMRAHLSKAKKGNQNAAKTPPRRAK